MTANKKENSWRILLDQVESLVKPIAIFTGTFYVIGYVITAIRLDQYGVPTSKFIDAQYFVAGIVPGIFLWLTVFIIVSAYRYVAYEDKNDGKHKRPKARAAWKWVRVVFIGIIASMFLMFLLFTYLGNQFGELWDNLYPFGAFFVIAFGELSLWIFVVLLTNWHSCWREIRITRIAENRVVMKFGNLMLIIQMVFYWVFLPVVFLILMFVFIVPLSWEVYVSIPQAYGGGKPLAVVLYVDDKKVPAKLLEADPEADMSPPCYTIPLHLIFRTSNEYIVAPIKAEERQGWVIEASAVYALVEESNQ